MEEIFNLVTLYNTGTDDIQNNFYYRYTTGYLNKQIEQYEIDYKKIIKYFNLKDITNINLNGFENDLTILDNNIILTRELSDFINVTSKTVKKGILLIKIFPNSEILNETTNETTIYERYCFSRSATYIMVSINENCKPYYRIFNSMADNFSEYLINLKYWDKLSLILNDKSFDKNDKTLGIDVDNFTVGSNNISLPGVNKLLNFSYVDNGKRVNVDQSRLYCENLLIKNNEELSDIHSSFGDLTTENYENDIKNNNVGIIKWKVAGYNLYHDQISKRTYCFNIRSSNYITN